MNSKRFYSYWSYWLFFLFWAYALPAYAGKTIEHGIRSKLQRDLSNCHGLGFSSIVKKWEQEFGVHAVSALLQIASVAELTDSERYIAMMSATKLGGIAVAPAIVPFLKDPSWMIRSGALIALRALKQTSTSKAVLPLLEDPSLVVRREAVDTVKILQPPGAASALVKAAFSEKNYHQGKAIWVPQAALRALAFIKARETAADLSPLLSHYEDPDLRNEVFKTLAKLASQ